jgi:dihydrofolate synthase/folylpolyglutamate synthase
MNYEEALEYLYHSLPMYQRIGAAAFKKDLNNTLKLCEGLGNPQNNFKSIHIAGTNGKGSVAHMLASILQLNGYKTGLYTSPHLKKFTERIKINGQEINESFVASFITNHKELINNISPSFFEMTVAMCFEYFSERSVDLAVIETGLGGRLDSTNVLQPELVIITNISMDHQEMLGDTLEKIAFEKAGIIKENIPLVIGERQSGLDMLFDQWAKEKKTTPTYASDAFKLERRDPDALSFVGEADRWVIHSKEIGPYQEKNIPTVLRSCEMLKNHGFSLNKERTLAGIEKVNQITGLKARWQVIYREPMVLVDAAHNEDGIRLVVSHLLQQSYDQLHFILGFSKEKDVRAILELFPSNAHYHYSQASVERAMAASDLNEIAADMKKQGEVIPDVNDALEQVLKKASPSDLIFIGGSLFLLAELKVL